MPSLRDVRPDDLEAVLPSFVLTTRIIYLAMGGAVLMMGGVVAGLYLANPDAQGGAGLLGALSAVNAAVTLAAYSAVPIVYSRVLSRERLEALAGGEAPPGEEAGRAAARAVAGAIQAAEIARIAVLEGTATLGLVVCMIGALQGGLREQPLYWLNTIPAAAFLWFVLTHLPEPGRFREAYRAKVLGGA